MPPTTPVQLACGSATVVVSTLSMLLLFDPRSIPGVAVAALVGLGLGLLVTVTVPVSGRRAPGTAGAAPASRIRASGGQVPRPRVPADAGEHVGGHSLRR